MDFLPALRAIVDALDSPPVGWRALQMLDDRADCPAPLDELTFAALLVDLGWTVAEIERATVDALLANGSVSDLRCALACAGRANDEPSVDRICSVLATRRAPLLVLPWSL